MAVTYLCSHLTSDLLSQGRREVPLLIPARHLAQPLFGNGLQALVSVCLLSNAPMLLQLLGVYGHSEGRSPGPAILFRLLTTDLGRPRGHQTHLLFSVRSHSGS